MKSKSFKNYFIMLILLILLASSVNNVCLAQDWCITIEPNSVTVSGADVDQDVVVTFTRTDITDVTQEQRDKLVIEVDDSCAQYITINSCIGTDKITADVNITVKGTAPSSTCTIKVSDPQGAFDPPLNCEAPFTITQTQITTTIAPTKTVPTTTTTALPTLVSLIEFNAIPGNSTVNLVWSTESEIDNAGFNIYRAESEDGEYVKINDFMIPAQGSSTEGAFYEFIDKDVRNRKTYYYKLEDIDLNGNSTMHDPVSARPRLIFGIFKK
jgi:hypothetical protein